MIRRGAQLLCLLGIAGLPLFPFPASGMTPVDRPSELRVLTYNVLADPVHVDQRVPELMHLMQASDADVIALQEVAPWFAAKLMREPWVANYHHATRDGKLVIAHEHLILSRFPILAEETAPLPGNQHRVAHIVTLELDGVPTAIATCHLESLLEDCAMRARQLEVFFTKLNSFEQAIFAGDFNFGDGELPETAALPGSYQDAWLVVRPQDPGYTWDRTRSRMARDASFPGERSRRLDRILIRSTRWKPISAALVGDAPTAGRRKSVFPSDHFGVLAVLARVEATEASP